MVIALLDTSISGNCLAQNNTGFTSECVTDDPVYKTAMSEIGFYSDTTRINYNTWEKAGDKINFSFLISTACDYEFNGRWSRNDSNIYLNYEETSIQNRKDLIVEVSDCACLKLLQWKTSLTDIKDLNIYLNNKETEFVPKSELIDEIERKKSNLLITEACKLKSHHGDTINLVGQLEVCMEYMWFKPLFDDECTQDYSMELEYSRTIYDEYLKDILDKRVCDSFMIIEARGILIKDGELYGHLGSNNSKFIIEKVYRTSGVGYLID